MKCEEKERRAAFYILIGLRRLHQPNGQSHAEVLSLSLSHTHKDTHTHRYTYIGWRARQRIKTHPHFSPLFFNSSYTQDSVSDHYFQSLCSDNISPSPSLSLSLSLSLLLSHTHILSLSVSNSLLLAQTYNQW